eukprot:s868_g2.t1
MSGATCVDAVDNTIIGKGCEGFYDKVEAVDCDSTGFQDLHCVCTKDEPTTTTTTTSPGCDALLPFVNPGEKFCTEGEIVEKLEDPCLKPTRQGCSSVALCDEVCNITYAEDRHQARCLQHCASNADKFLNFVKGSYGMVEGKCEEMDGAALLQRKVESGVGVVTRHASHLSPPPCEYNKFCKGLCGAVGYLHACEEKCMAAAHAVKFLLTEYYDTCIGPLQDDNAEALDWQDVTPWSTKVIVKNTMATPALVLEACQHHAPSPDQVYEHWVAPGEHAIVTLGKSPVGSTSRRRRSTSAQVFSPQRWFANSSKGLQVETQDPAVVIQDLDIKIAERLHGSLTIPMILRNEHFEDTLQSFHGA